MKKTNPKITKQQLEQYLLLYPLLKSAYEEIKELSKKKQDGILNELKVNMIKKY